MSDPRPSRRDKLLLITPMQLLIIVRDWLFGFYAICDMIHVLRSAAERDDEESIWLMGKIHDIPKFGSAWKLRLQWLVSTMTTDDSSYANYYRGRALFRLGEKDTGIMFLRKSANAGFASAMAELGYCLVLEGIKEIGWMEKAAEREDPDGFYWVAVGENSFKHLRNAVSRGHIYAMNVLALSHKCKLSPVDILTFQARYMLLSGDEHKMDNSYHFIIGRELEGYEQLWGSYWKPKKEYLGSIELYLDITHRARRAALQTTVGLRMRLGRDVARLIGKMVYESRDDVEVWKN